MRWLVLNITVNWANVDVGLELFSVKQRDWSVLADCWHHEDKWLRWNVTNKAEAEINELKRKIEKAIARLSVEGKFFFMQNLS